jgi:hypothetical protein
VIILGVILLVLGLLLSVPILYTLGIILLVIGVILYILGSVGRPLAGRRHYWSVQSGSCPRIALRTPVRPARFETEPTVTGFWL